MRGEKKGRRSGETVCYRLGFLLQPAKQVVHDSENRLIDECRLIIVDLRIELEK
jgi:hypothetical protein